MNKNFHQVQGNMGDPNWYAARCRGIVNDVAAVCADCATPVAAGAGTVRKDFVDYGTDGRDITKSVVICADCKKVRRFGK